MITHNSHNSHIPNNADHGHSVLMKVNKDYRKKKKNEALWVVIDSYDNKGDAIFSEVIDEGGHFSYGVQIHEKYLDVITSENDPEYFL